LEENDRHPRSDFFFFSFNVFACHYDLFSPVGALLETCPHALEPLARIIHVWNCDADVPEPTIHAVVGVARVVRRALDVLRAVVVRQFDQALWAWEREI
jgi:hypothetical protein